MTVPFPPFSSDERHVLPSGTTVHVWRTNSRVGTVVLQHGFGEYSERFVAEHGQLVPRLVASGFEVWAADLWGHGRSPGTRGVASARLSVKDHLVVRRRAQARDVPTFLIGHSLGGLVTAGSVAADQHGIDGVILSSPALPTAPKAVGRFVLGAAAAAFPRASLPVPRVPDSALSRRHASPERPVTDPLRTQRQIPLVLAATALDVMRSVRQSAPSWAVPTLMLHGTADRHTDPGGSQDLFDSIAASDKELRVIDGGYHELLDDLAGDVQVDGIIEWLHGHLRVADKPKDGAHEV